MYARVENYSDVCTFYSVSLSVPQSEYYVKPRFYIQMKKRFILKFRLRYYMDESKAKLVEEEYNKSLRWKGCLCTVRIHNGDAVVDGLYIWIQD